MERPGPRPTDGRTHSEPIPTATHWAAFTALPAGAVLSALTAQADKVCCWGDSSKGQDIKPASRRDPSSRRVPAPPLPTPLAPADEPQQPVNQPEPHRGAGSFPGGDADPAPHAVQPGAGHLLSLILGGYKRDRDSRRSGEPREREDPWLRPGSRQASIMVAVVLKALKNCFTSFLTVKTQRITNRFERG